MKMQMQIDLQERLSFNRVTSANMGKASKWFRGLLGLKKPDPNPNPSPNHIQKKKWSFTKSHKEKVDRSTSHHGVDYGGEVNRHAVAVAAATARVAEASVAAKHSSTSAHVSRGNKNCSATAQVGRSSAGCDWRGEEWAAAVTIQSHFRAYLSRRALCALKALVKLQALVRGHLMRKRTADALKQLQALVRAQTRARVGRVLASESPHSSMKSSHFSYPGPETPDKFEHVCRARSMSHENSLMLKRNGSKSYGSVNYDPEKSHLSRIRMDSKVTERLWDERSDKILEVDTGKPQVTPKRRNLFQSSHFDQNSQSFSTSKDSTARQTLMSPSSVEIRSLGPLNFPEENESAFCTANNSPQLHSASCSSKREAFTPTKSDGSRSCLSGYSDNPSYMAYTESSKAKVRSLSTPKQRQPQYERSSSTKRCSVHGYGDSTRPTQRVSPLQANFANKAYPGSGRLDRLGMPVTVKGDVTGFSGSHWLRY